MKCQNKRAPHRRNYAIYIKHQYMWQSKYLFFVDSFLFFFDSFFTLQNWKIDSTIVFIKLKQHCIVRWQSHTLFCVCSNRSSRTVSFDAKIYRNVHPSREIIIDCRCRCFSCFLTEKRYMEFPITITTHTLHLCERVQLLEMRRYTLQHHNMNRNILPFFFFAWLTELCDSNISTGKVGFYFFFLLLFVAFRSRRYVRHVHHHHHWI